MWKVLSFRFGVAVAVLSFTTTVSAQEQEARELQNALLLLGYDTGVVDGKLGNRTKTAFAQFLADTGGQLEEFDTVPALRRVLSYQRSLFAQFNLRDNFSATPITMNVPIEYVWTEGLSAPKYQNEAYGVKGLFVFDFNNDGCDDILTQYSDSYAQPGIVWGRADGKLEWVKYSDVPATRTLRNASQRDLNADGVLDLVLWTAPHGWHENELGAVWDGDEPDLLFLSGEKPRSLELETYTHGGFLGDVDGDGIPDVFPIGEFPGNKETRVPYLNIDGELVVAPEYSLLSLKDKMISAAISEDLNGDGLDDYVFLTGKALNDRNITPDKATEIGTFAYAFGEAGKSLDELKFMSMGSHWAGRDELESLKLSIDPASEYTQASSFVNSAPGSLDLIDFDNDGDKDVFIYSFVQYNSSWQTSGFNIYENTGDSFVDVTNSVAPYQFANRDLITPTGHLFRFSHVDLNGDEVPDLVLSLMGNDWSLTSLASAAIYINEDGQYKPVASLKAPLDRVELLTAGDFNCDGKSDLTGFSPPTQPNATSERLLAFLHK